MAVTLVVDVLSDFKSRGFDQAESAMSRVGKAATVAATAVAGGLVVGATKAVQAASNLAESMNAVSQVFGPASAKIDQFGKTAATSIGLSQRAFNELATSTGALLTNFGLSTSQAADATIDLSKRAADMASVFNTDVSTAMEAINAGLRGETEPLRQFGVNLDDATLKAKALEMGLYDGKGALDSNAKAQAAMAVIMEKTANTAGDFTNTANGLANSQRILGGQVENLMAALGQALLPVVTQVVGLFQQFATWAQNNTGAVQALVTVIAALAAGILATKAAVTAYQAVQTVVTAATKAWQIAQAALNIVLSANPIGLVVTAIAALVAGLVYAYQHSETFRNAVQAVGNFLKGVFVGAINAVKTALSAVGDWFGRVASTVGGAFRSAWQSVVGVINSVANAIRNVITWITNAIAKVREFFSSGIGRIGSAIGGIFGRSATGRAAPIGRAAATQGRAGGTIVVRGATNPQYLAQDLARIMTGARVRTGYQGVRL